jgi:hypothetical protein
VRSVTSHITHVKVVNCILTAGHTAGRPIAMPKPDPLASFVEHGRAAQKAADKAISKAMQSDRTAGAEISPTTTATHRVYTPVWDYEQEKFEAWLEVGKGWVDGKPSNFIHIDRTPIDPERNDTGYLRLVAIDEPPPAPLTISRAEFMEQIAEQS